MRNIPARKLQEFRNGKFRVSEITECGQYVVRGREGSADKTIDYSAGDLVLTDQAGLILCGPINKERSVNLALRVLQGEQRAVLDSQTVFALAVGVIAELDPGRFAECGA